MTQWVIGANGRVRRARLSDWRTRFDTEREAWVTAKRWATRRHAQARELEREAARKLARSERVLVEVERALERLPRAAAKGAK